ncbi:hypothetical protein [Leucobacter sp. 1207-22]|uniref:hypothetical protein n=1 Tax=Leucobacter sp. 1207-22 TaxID=2604456 RepID=UPI0040629ADE
MIGQFMRSKTAFKSLATTMLPLYFATSFLQIQGNPNTRIPEANRASDSVIVETVHSEGITHQYSFDLQAEIVTLELPGGSATSVTFDELEQLAAGLVDEYLASPEGLSYLNAQGLSAYAPAKTSRETTYLQAHPWCSQVAKIAGALNTAAWRALASVIGMHPLVRIVTVGGHAAFWVWVRSNC